MNFIQNRCQKGHFPKANTFIVLVVFKNFHSFNRIIVKEDSIEIYDDYRK